MAPHLTQARAFVGPCAVASSMPKAEMLGRAGAWADVLALHAREARAANALPIGEAEGPPEEAIILFRVIGIVFEHGHPSPHHRILVMQW